MSSITIQRPQTPTNHVHVSLGPSGSYKSSSLSPAGSVSSSADSGVGDVSDSPQKPKPFKSTKASKVAKGLDETSSLTGTENLPARDESQNTIMADDPFHSEESRILFDAIDKLQAHGSDRFLKIPQLVIVGGQSSGKSSLLRTLTGIPFPVGGGCCTRFPIRIVSRRTAPGERDSYRISIEEAKFRVENIPRSSKDIAEYEKKGERLSTEDFVRAMDEISDGFLDIRRGTADDDNNFSTEIVKVELSGPQRSHFSILDLPGIFVNPAHVKASEMKGIKQLAIAYMEEEENIVVCVADAPVDYGSQAIFPLASGRVNSERLIGVFTKCDIVSRMPSALKGTIEIVTEKVQNQNIITPSRWFVVRNRDEESTESFDLEAAERELFGTAPWTTLPQEWLGSVALKKHLGHLLCRTIRSAFPNIKKDIDDKLRAREAEIARLGEPRNDLHTMRKYLDEIARQYEEKVAYALGRPGFLDSESMELRREASRLNEEFDWIMRQKGATWEFQCPNMDARTELMILLKRIAQSGKAPKEQETPIVSHGRNFDCNKAFPDCSQVESYEALFDEIGRQIDQFRGTMLPGIPNPDVYPKMHSLQVGKWPKISNIHLNRVRSAVRNSYRAILASVCPPTGATAILHGELLSILDNRFDLSFRKASRLCRELCEKETHSPMLDTTNPDFESEVGVWQRLRFCHGWLASKNNEEISPENDAADNFEYILRLCHPAVRENKICEVHDVLKVYYKLALETFIRTMTNKVVEEFISDASGPLRSFNRNFVNFELSEEEVERLAREDKETARQRRWLQMEIEGLQRAQGVTELAAERTGGLEKVH